MLALLLGLALGQEALAADLLTSEPRRGSAQQVAQTAPAAPNASRVTGELLSVETVESAALRIAPPQILTRLRVRILSIQPVESMIDSLHGQEGRLLEAYSKGSVDVRLIGKTVTFVVRRRGDEHGGIYWADDPRELPRERGAKGGQ